jgi:hypothetical protein
LVKRVGQIKSYGYSGGRLSARQLEQCNAGAAVAKTKAKPSPTTKGTRRTAHEKRPTARRSTPFRVPGTLTMTGAGTTGTVFSVPGTLTMTGQTGGRGTVFAVPGTLTMTGASTSATGSVFQVPRTLTMTGTTIQGITFAVPGTLTMTGVNR